MKALIYNIQKFSLNDGPGIRTVIFFKGCPLRCKWCSNPESQSPKIEILWDREKCIGCGTCEKVCPQKAILFSSGDVFIQKNLCDACGICVDNCSGQALTSAGAWRTVEDVLQICRQDLPFYEESGGGITLSGGEPLMVPDYVTALLSALRAEGVHTAMETSGFAKPEILQRVVAHLDLVLFDMKHWDQDKHIQGTGVSNQLILENLKRIVVSDVKVIPRIPVIPGYNDSLDDAQGFSKKILEVGLSEVQLLPFHRFGDKKYESLGMKYRYSDIPPLHAEGLGSYQQVFIRNQINAFF